MLFFCNVPISKACFVLNKFQLIMCLCITGHHVQRMMPCTSNTGHCEMVANILGVKSKTRQSTLGPAKGYDHNMAFSYRSCVMPPYATFPNYSTNKPAYLYVPSPIVDDRGFPREYIKHRGGMIIDMSHSTKSGPLWEQKWINYVNVVNSIKPWRSAGKPFVCDRLWLWAS